MLIRILCLVFVVFSLSGCWTSRASSSRQLELRVAQLERKIQYKEDEIRSLKYSLEEVSDELDSVRDQQSKMRRSEVRRAIPKPQPKKITIPRKEKEGPIIRVPIDAEQVQMALQNAGFYQGPIDGKIGGQTKSAISDFQKEHGLTPDGIIGKRTWSELQRYLQ